MEVGFPEPMGTTDVDTPTEVIEESDEQSSESLLQMPSSESSNVKSTTTASDSASMPSTSISISDELMPSGFTLVRDNVGKMVKAAHHSTERQNKMMLCALSFAVCNRIPTCHLVDQETVKVVDIPTEKFLPMAEDIQQIKHRLKIIVSRILVEEVPFFKENFSALKHIRQPLEGVVTKE